MKLPSFAQVVFNAQYKKLSSFSKILPPLRLNGRTIISAAYRSKEKCIHKRSKYICRECHGSSLCKHNKRKYMCDACRGPKRGYLRALQNTPY